LGYVPRENNFALAIKLDKGWNVKARINSVSCNLWEGVFIDILIHKSENYLRISPGHVRLKEEWVA